MASNQGQLIEASADSTSGGKRRLRVSGEVVYLVVPLGVMCFGLSQASLDGWGTIAVVGALLAGIFSGHYLAGRQIDHFAGQNDYLQKEVVRLAERNTEGTRKELGEPRSSAPAGSESNTP